MPPLSHLKHAKSEGFVYDACLYQTIELFFSKMVFLFTPWVYANDYRAKFESVYP